MTVRTLALGVLFAGGLALAPLGAQPVSPTGGPTTPTPPPPTTPPSTGLRGSLSLKSFYIVPDNAGVTDLDDPADRERLRDYVSRKTVEFANSFVREVKSGAFEAELDRLVQVAGGGASRDKLVTFLGTLNEIPDPENLTAASLPANLKDELKKIQLAWTLVQLVRYGAPGFRTTFDAGGVADAGFDFVESVDGDRELLERIKAFEDDFERYIEVARPGESTARPPPDQAEQLMYAALVQLVSSSNLDNPPTAAQLQTFAAAIVAEHLTPGDQIWSISASWHSFSGSSAEVQGRSGAAMFSSGAQILSWSLPRMDLDDPDAARDEIGKAYNFSFSGAGWEGKYAFSGGAWSLASGDGMTYTPNGGNLVPDPLAPDVKVLQSLNVDAEPVEMEVRDESPVLAGYQAAPDTIQVADVVQDYWKELEAFATIPEQLGDVTGSVTAPSGSGNNDPTGRFSIGGSGGSFP